MKKDKQKILVVDDEKFILALLKDILDREGYEVSVAQNGKEALQSLNSELPDLIISDIMMPKMDGFTLQAAIQEKQETRAIPFIFLTAKADEGSQLKGRRTGVDDYITKPFDIDQLISRVQRLVTVPPFTHVANHSISKAKLVSVVSSPSADVLEDDGNFVASPKDSLPELPEIATDCISRLVPLSVLKLRSSSLSHYLFPRTRF